MHKRRPRCKRKLNFTVFSIRRLRSRYSLNRAGGFHAPLAFHVKTCLTEATKRLFLSIVRYAFCERPVAPSCISSFLLCFSASAVSGFGALLRLGGLPTRFVAQCVCALKSLPRGCVWACPPSRFRRPHSAWTHITILSSGAKQDSAFRRNNSLGGPMLHRVPG